MDSGKFHTLALTTVQVRDSVISRKPFTAERYENRISGRAGVDPDFR